MRIALVIERMDPSRGGRERSTMQIARHLAARGHDVDVLCQGDAAAADPAPDAGGRVVCRPLGRRGLTYARRLAAFVGDVGDAVRGVYDVVHATLPVPVADIYEPRGGTVPARMAASLRRRCLPARTVARATAGLNSRRRAMSRLEAQVVGDARIACLAVSRMVAREFAEHYGRSENVHVVYNAVDAPSPDDPRRDDWRQEQRFRLGMDRDEVLFLTVATNFALKGVDRTIEAFARWAHAARGRRGRLVIVGREHAEPYARHASLRDVGGRVTFVERTDEVFRWYAAADVCVLLSWYDPCSRVVLEATRWGIPSITTAYNGAAEVLTEGAASPRADPSSCDGAAGIVVDSPRDVRAAAEAMAELSEPDERARYARAGLSAAPTLSMQRYIDELLGIYERLGRH
ncbi:MAG: glycosyltransferase family 4 protein [Planctomycetota bacterium]